MNNEDGERVSYAEYDTSSNFRRWSPSLLKELIFYLLIMIFVLSIVLYLGIDQFARLVLEWTGFNILSLRRV